MRSRLQIPRIFHSRIALAATACAAMMSCSHRQSPRAITPSIGTRQTGIASWYGHPYHGRATASGEIYDMELDTAAHQRFAFGTWLRVDNLDNGKRTEVRVNDRGPFVRGRIIDLSRASARRIDMLGPGTAKVRLTVIAAPGRPSHQPPPSPPTSSSSTATHNHNNSTPPDVIVKWGVQVASFRDALRAETMLDSLRGQGHRATLQPFGEWTRVVVIASSDEAARRLLDTLRLGGYPQAALFSTGIPLP